MGRTRPRYPSPPDDVCDTPEEVDAHYLEMEDAVAEEDSRRPDPWEE